jgi:hypothetical protein
MTGRRRPITQSRGRAKRAAGSTLKSIDLLARWRGIRWLPGRRKFAIACAQGRA